MHPLDNVIWQALGTTQAHLGESQDSARRFLPEVSLLGGISTPTQENYDSLACLLRPDERIGIFLESPPSTIKEWTVLSAVPLLEMVHDNGKARTSELERTSPVIVPLGPPDVPEMVSLTELTKPGPFGPRTREMGEYWGIRDDAGKLIAMAGERLKVPGHTEISAVCTHPQHSGKGYATALIALLMRRIADRDETSFLHVRPENTRAVGLYELLGFRNRVSLYYVVLSKVGT